MPQRTCMSRRGAGFRPNPGLRPQAPRRAGYCCLRISVANNKLFGGGSSRAFIVIFFMLAILGGFGIDLVRAVKALLRTSPWGFHPVETTPARTRLYTADLGANRAKPVPHGPWLRGVAHHISGRLARQSPPGQFWACSPPFLGFRHALGMEACAAPPPVTPAGFRARSPLLA